MSGKAGIVHFEFSIESDLWQKLLALREKSIVEGDGMPIQDIMIELMYEALAAREAMDGEHARKTAST